MDEREFYDYIMENFNLDGTASRLVDNIITYVKDENFVDAEDAHTHLISLLGGAFGIEDSEIKLYRAPECEICGAYAPNGLYEQNDKLLCSDCVEQDYSYEICGKDGKVIESAFVCLDTAIEYALENEGYSINKLWFPLDKDGEIDYGAEVIAAEVAWERSDCESCIYRGNCIDPDKHEEKGVVICDNFKREEEEDSNGS